MEEFLHFMQGEMTEPGVFSWFHFLALVPIITAAILVPWFLRNCSGKTYKRVLLFAWVTLLILEVGKQIVKAFHYGLPSYWEYSYRDFPFSICSMPYFFLPVLLFVNREKRPKIVDAATGYVALILLVAGVVVCLYPAMVTSRFIYINIQTFIHHGSQVVLGIFVYVWNRRTVTIKTYYRSLIAFGITAVIAILINIAFQPHFINMFFINPLIITNLPIGNIVQEKAGYPVYLLGFLSVISLAAFLAYLAETSLNKWVEKRKAKAGQ